MNYHGRIAVVTGAGSGIGRALTQALTRGGAHVAAADIDEKGVSETQAACPPGQVTPYRVDVADRDAVLGFAEDVHRQLGPASMLFNNAGVDLFASVADMSWKDFDWLIGINIGGVVNGTKAFLPQLVEAGSAQHPSRLVNLSSAFGLIAVPYQGAYSTAKFAVRGFTEALRQEMIIERHPVTVHCVHPGVVKTNFGANMRAAETEDPDQAAKLFARAAITSPEKAARLILRGAEKNRARILIGPDGRVMAAMPRLLGAHYAAVQAYAARVTNSRSGRAGA
ncbi:SDR family NAD(P)-dependent oxidoreductase [Mycobacterium intracellulare]|uniref:SDR family NAD(P)-dependent oxidoreductase n=1 Tax=Mycobacterium intracellulare subsp. chimaera TaxID=222805 RepID=A0A220XS69_MYCIT|nr:SDR family NAD(P)-dependent oxidoreductase [Mycobacterium intracellulare]ASL14195.1 short chain dehydrogenase/reductase family oxidoreductase [Mycobacterium intracellulare subsp. chimaera]ASQ85497.1 acetoin dehydrogenase [Mycobacterium intracellulare subsp. chimaera]ASW99830.1 acetoin dehydrogenase [Mycobacterium intracellulare subsp. chimaera]MCF1811235.1 SDR family NAD(P)-dependent oxidoreductase [Mycobacterium intracellulare subsp. intracellulare]MDM3925158.1 SDR family NAD(P)-dependent 